MNISDGLDLSQWTKVRLLVVGDVMVDEYLWGRVERISPEAPVPVVEIQRETAVLGGAGNVVRNLRGLGAWATLAGVAGADPAAERLLELLSGEGIDSAGLIRVPGRRTCRKSRIMAGHQQVARLDRETKEPIGPGVARRIVGLARDHLAAFDGLILSDYAKGLLTPGLVKALVELFRGAGRPVVVDPKGRDFSRYRGATLLTPNQREASLALGLDCARMAAAERRAEALLSRHRWSALLVTRGSQGVSLFRPGQPALTVPAQARQVFDVSGAGDTVAAVVGLSLACGWPLDLAACLGNLAGGIVVGKLGTAAVTAEELRLALRPDGEEKEAR